MRFLGLLAANFIDVNSQARIAVEPLHNMKLINHLGCALLLCLTQFSTAAEPMRLDDTEFQRKFRTCKNERDDAERHRRFSEMARAYRLTSLQVKAITQSMRNDDARLEFATAAFPRTLDPENFYEVYDAFDTFSKVMRLHDRVRPIERQAAPIGYVPPLVDKEEFGGIVKSLRGESFDNTRTQVARQIFTTSRGLFLSAQVKQILDLFDFEQNKLAMAKLAYEFTFDKEKYYLVNEAFGFENSKTELSRYIEESNKKKTPRPANRVNP